MQLNQRWANPNRIVQLSRQLPVGLIFLTVGLALASVPNQLEGPSLLHLSPGHGISVSDVVALIPLLLGIGLIVSSVWQTRTQRWQQFNARLSADGVDIFLMGMAVGLLIMRFTFDLPWGRLLVWVFIAIIGLLRLFILQRHTDGLGK